MKMSRLPIVIIVVLTFAISTAGQRRAALAADSPIDKAASGQAAAIPIIQGTYWTNFAKLQVIQHQQAQQITLNWTVYTGAGELDADGPDDPSEPGRRVFIDGEQPQP